MFFKFGDILQQHLSKKIHTTHTTANKLSIAVKTKQVQLNLTKQNMMIIKHKMDHLKVKLLFNNYLII